MYLIQSPNAMNVETIKNQYYQYTHSSAGRAAPASAVAVCPSGLYPPRPLMQQLVLDHCQEGDGPSLMVHANKPLADRPNVRCRL